LLGEIITFLYITAALLSIIPHYRRSGGSLLKANARDGLLNEISTRGRDVPSALLLFSGNDNERDFTLRGALPDMALLSLTLAIRTFSDIATIPDAEKHSSESRFAIDERRINYGRTLLTFSSARSMEKKN